MSKLLQRSLLAIVLIAALGFSLVSAQDSKTPRGGTVVISEGQQSAFQAVFNPYNPNPTRWTRGTMFEPLIIWNPVDGKPVWTLATDYKYSDDLKSVTFTMRPDVKWSDGEALTSADVVFTFNLIKKYPALDWRGILPFVESAEAPDAGTVVFHLSKVYTQAHIVLGKFWPLPEHQWKDVADPVTFTNTTPVGSGPLTDVQQINEQVMKICRNPNYWQKDENGEQLPYIDCIQMPVYLGNDPANLASANGEVDWIANFIPDIEKTFVSADPEHHHYYFWPGGSTVQYYMNTTKAPFSDVAFRKALSMGIDRDSIANIGEYGYAIPANAVGLGPAFDSWVNKDALASADKEGVGKFDVAAANAALDAAGYVDKDNDGWRDNPDGTPIAFKIQVVNGWTDWVTSVQIIGDTFSKDLKLNASVVTPEFGDWLNNLQSGTFDTSIGWSTAGLTPWDFYRGVLNKAFLTSDGTANANVWSRWFSDDAQKLLDDFVLTTDEAKQHDIMNQLQQIYVDNVPAIPLFPGPTWYEWNDKRFTGFPTQDNYYTQGSSWEEEYGTRDIVVNKIHCVDNTSCGQGS